jgi:putative restriction endonuclease
MPNRFEWGRRAWPLLTFAARHRQTFFYEGVAERLKMGTPRAVRFALGPIQDLCMEKGWPALTSIVLTKKTGRPGPGFIAWEGDLAEAHEAVFTFPWHKLPAPFSKAFQDRIKRAESGSGHSGVTAPTNFEVPDQMVLVNGRRAFQSRFRQLLLRVYDYQCVLCETDLESLLVASHIVPWSADRRNRLNPQNGLLLCRTHDCLFDSGIVRITPEGRVSWPGISRASLGRDLYDFVTERTATHLWMPKGPHRPDPTFLQWKLDNPGSGSLNTED